MNGAEEGSTDGGVGVGVSPSHHCVGDGFLQALGMEELPVG